MTDVPLSEVLNTMRKDSFHMGLILGIAISSIVLFFLFLHHRNITENMYSALDYVLEEGLGGGEQNCTAIDIISDEE